MELVAQLVWVKQKEEEEVDVLGSNPSIWVNIKLTNFYLIFGKTFDMVIMDLVQN